MNEEISVGMYFSIQRLFHWSRIHKIGNLWCKGRQEQIIRIILVKDRLSHISKSIYVLYRKHSLLLNLPSLDICCFLLEFFTTTCFSHFSESKISMKSAVYLIRSYPFLCVQQIKVLDVTMLLYQSATSHLHITQYSIKIDE